MFSGPSFLFQFLVSFTIQNVLPPTPGFPNTCSPGLLLSKLPFLCPSVQSPWMQEKGRKAWKGCSVFWKEGALGEGCAV